MKHFATKTTSYSIRNVRFLFGDPTSVGSVGVIDALFTAMDVDPDRLVRFTDSEVSVASLETHDSTVFNCACYFVFGGRYTNPWSRPLREALSPAEFGILVALRVWFRIMEKQVNFCSPRFWTKTADFLYVNLNLGRSVVFIDDHAI